CLRAAPLFLFFSIVVLSTGEHSAAELSTARLSNVLKSRFCYGLLQKSLSVYHEQDKSRCRAQIATGGNGIGAECPSGPGICAKMVRRYPVARSPDDKGTDNATRSVTRGRGERE